MPPAYAKHYVERQKNDTADAEATCEAVTRSNMRFVPRAGTSMGLAGQAPLQRWALGLLSCSVQGNVIFDPDRDFPIGAGEVSAFHFRAFNFLCLWHGGKRQ